MQTEYEVKILEYSKDQIIHYLEERHGTQVHPQFLMKRTNFHIVPATPDKRVRLRQEFGKCTLTYKSKGNDNQKDPLMMRELEIKVDDFDIAKALLQAAGLQAFVYEENYREKRKLDHKGHHVEFCFDQRPGIPEYLEIETDNESTLKELCNQLGLDYDQGVFGSAFDAYERYGFDRHTLRAQGTITFQNIPQKKG